MKNQLGMTLLELLIATAIMALVAGGVGPAISQFASVPSIISNGLTVRQDARIAIHWVGIDAQMAQTTDLVDGGPPASGVTLLWTDQYAEGAVDHTSSYSLTGKVLSRSYDGQVMTVARYVSGVEFTRVGSAITVRITSAVDGTSRESVASFQLRSNG